MKTTCLSIWIFLFSFGFSSSRLFAQPVVIKSFGSDGALTWTNAAGTNAFTVQWASSLAGPWNSDWSSVASLITTGKQTTVSVPMFYRVADGFTNSAVQGPWMFVKGVNNYSYIFFDGAGTITEMAIFYPAIPVGNYSVQTNGVFTSAVLTTSQGAFSLTGQVVSAQSAIFAPPYNTVQLQKITNMATCQGTWNGTLTESNSGPQTSISFNVDALGRTGIVTGLVSYAYGRMLCDTSNRVSAFFHTGAPTTNPYNQVQLSGTLSNNAVNGLFYIDTAGSAANGSFTLQKQ